MAPDSRLAKLQAHIAACHSAVLPGSRLRLRAGQNHIGYVSPELASRLAALTAAVTVSGDTVHLTPEALPSLNKIALAAGIRVRNEDFDVRAFIDGPVLGVLDRGALPDFGVIGVGVHLNGLVRRQDGLHLWIAKRAADKKLDPGKLDNLVAGGVPAGLSPWETLIKEAAEEASLPTALAKTSQPVARFAYNMERPEGLRRDVVYAYDVDLPESFTPLPSDGEVESFELIPLTRALEIMTDTDDFKFNVNLVIIDLSLRHRLIQGDDARQLRAALNK